MAFQNTVKKPKLPRQKEIYECLFCQQAAQNKIFTKDIKDAIKMQQKIETATGKRVTLIDISNIQQNAKKDFQEMIFKM